MSAQPLHHEAALLAPSPDVLALSRDVLARHARTFRLASLLLTSTQRDEAALLYAFCRLVDDTVDEAPDHAQARADLDALRDELHGRRTPRSLIAAFTQLCALRRIPLSAAHELIHGVASDLDDVRIPDDEALLRYCYRVAGTVGLMMCGVIGVTQDRALPFAVDLGVGMQLTNICRDVLEDAHRRRVYLPAHRLAAAGTSQDALLAAQAPRDAVAAVVNDLLLLAEQHYDSAQQGLRYIPTRPRAAIAAASRMYRAIGWRLRDRGGDALQGRTIVPGSHKALHLLRAAITSLSAARGHEPTHDPALHRLLRGLPGTNPPP